MNLINIRHDYPALRLSTFIIALDTIWLKFLAKDFYLDRINKINIGSFDFRRWPIVLIYISLILGLSQLVLPVLTPESTFIEVWKVVRFYALSVYGIYNFTNHTIFEKWDWKITVLDIAWGLFVCTLATWLTLKTGMIVDSDDDDDDDEFANLV